MSKYQKHNVPHERSAGKATTSCERCGTHRGVIRKYGINICRRCFREIAPSIGFEKYE